MKHTKFQIRGFALPLTIVALSSCGLLQSSQNSSNSKRNLKSSETHSALSSRAMAEATKIVSLQWKKGSLTEATLANVLASSVDKLGFTLGQSDFVSTDVRDLAHFRYERYVQIDPNTKAQIEGTSVRIWRSLTTNELILADLFVTPPLKTESFETANFNSSDISDFLKSNFSKDWEKGEILSLTIKPIFTPKGKWLRQAFLKTKTQDSIFLFENHSLDIVSSTLRPRGQADAQIMAQVYPLWEYAIDGSSGGAPSPDLLQTLKFTQLKNLSPVYAQQTPEIYKTAKNSVFKDGLKTLEGPLSAQDIQAGKWNFGYLRSLFVPFYKAQGKPVGNSIEIGGSIRLVGKNVGVFIHPNAKESYPALIPWTNAPEFLQDGTQLENGESVSYYKPLSFGIPAKNTLDFARRLPFSDNGQIQTDDVAGHIAMGFDEVQVYTGVDTFLESLRALGFTDPDLSTRPFTAVLFDPSLDAKNNAYYYDDKINFTTYDSVEANLARDNPTIWHELGHGIQDRLMGPNLDYAEGAGLSEGMADFLAEIIASDKFGSAPYLGRNYQRIVNNTFFYGTNESHDEGEAYGGSMRDMLHNMMQFYGDEKGLQEMTHLTLQTMRLLRDHPALTAKIWFETMLYADTLDFDALGEKRTPQKLHSFVLSSLERRNFSSALRPSIAEVTVDGTLITDRSPGARGRGIPVTLGEANQKTFTLEAKIDPAEANSFVFPVTVKITFNGWALQGSNRWVDEDKPEKFVAVLKNPTDVAKFTLALEPKCDAANTTSALCSDYALVQFFSDGIAGKPQAKKRFYTKLVP